MARVCAFLDACGKPNEPIATAWRINDAGRVIPRSAVRLFAPDVRTLHDAVSVLMDELRAQWEAAHYDHCGPLVDGVCPRVGQAPPNDCQWPLPSATDPAMTDVRKVH